MNLKSYYLVSLLLFYLSVPLYFNVEKIIFLARGYDRALVFEKKDTYSDEKMIEKYYAAYRREAFLIVFCARLVLVIWAATLVFSIVVIRKGVAIPFKLDIVTAVVSSILLMVTAVPFLIFGKSWPPRPF